MTASQPTRADLARYWSLALSNGLAEREDVVRWAQQLLGESGAPELWMQELAGCGERHIYDVLKWLDVPAAEAPDWTVAMRLYLAKLGEQLAADPLQADRVAEKVARLHFLSPKEPELERALWRVYGLWFNYQDLDCDEAALRGAVAEILAACNPEKALLPA